MKKFKMIAKKSISVFLCTATLFSFPITSYAGTGYNDPNIESQYYTNVSMNPYVKTANNKSYIGECTWYVYGRAYEKLGIKIPFTGNAKSFWTENQKLQGKGKGYACGSEPRSNSIMVWTNGKNGHVAFCENVIGDNVYITEANWGNDRGKTLIKGQERKQFGFKGYIYLEDEQPLEDGEYRIRSKIAPDKFADVELASKDDKAPLILFQGNGNDNQKFYFQYVGNGYYVIRCIHDGKVSEKVLDIEGGTSENASGKRIIQFEYNGNDNQLWRLEETSDGYFIIVSKLGNYAIDIYNGETEDMTPIIAFNKHGEDNQKFDLRAW